MNIINEKLVLSKKKLSSKSDLFKAIVEAAASDNRVSNKSGLLKDISSREKLGSTAFENGLIMPHARSKYIKDVTLVVVPFEDNSGFESLDGKPTNFAVSILVPEDAGDKHLQILSKLSSLYSTKIKLEKFKKMSKKEKISTLISTAKGETKIVKPVNGYDIVAISSCPAGIAHTYMARDAIIAAAKAEGLTVKVETQGATTENVLSAKDISGAKAVIIAVDTRVELDRFIGKRLYKTSTNNAIRNGETLIGKALKSKEFRVGSQTTNKNKSSESDVKEKRGFLKEVSTALMTAVSYMLPIIVSGALLFAIPVAIAASTGKTLPDGTFVQGHLPQFLQAMQDFGLTGFTKLAIPIIGMYVAFSIGGRPAMAAGLIGTFFANDGEKLYKWSYLHTSGTPQSAGFFGAIIIGVFAGYVVKYMQWIKWHRYIKPATGIIIIPLLSTFITFIFVVYIIGAPIAWVMSKLYSGLGDLTGSSKWALFGIGAIFGAMIAVDFGGPIGKVAWFVGNGIFVDTVKAGNPNLMPITAVAAAISLAPIGVFIATRLFRQKFEDEDIKAGTAALPLGMIGISEGALPFAFKYPFKLIIANVIAAILTSGLIAALGIIQWGGLGSPIGGWAGYTQHSWYGILWCLIITSGCFVTGIIFGLLKKSTPESKEAYKEYKKQKEALWNERGIGNQKADLPKKVVYITKHMFINAGPKLKYGLNPKNWFARPVDWD